MTEVVVCRKRDGSIVSVKVEGHSGYASFGQDIVCSSVTTLVQVLHVGLVDVLGMDVLSTLDEKKALIFMRWEEVTSESQAISSAVCESFRALSKTYPKNVKMVEVQVNAF